MNLTPADIERLVGEAHRPVLDTLMVNRNTCSQEFHWIDELRETSITGIRVQVKEYVPDGMIVMVADGKVLGVIDLCRGKATLDRKAIQ